MTTAAELLDELQGLGFTLSAEGDRIRVTPSSRLPAELRERIRLHRAELLAALDGPARFIVSERGEALDVTDAHGPPADPAALQARVDALTADPTWATRWAERLKAARYADLDAVRRTTADMVGFRSWARFALDHAAGRHWEQAARRLVAWPPDVAIITDAEAVATFADAEAVRQRRRPRPGRKDAR
jgi:hypothetical protein